MAYVYIQHLDPDHESMLSHILSKVTPMEVIEAKDKTKLARNCLYVMPPNKEMYITDGMLRLSPRPARPGVSMPINKFFMSLAERQKKGAIGVILSGNANDGATGLKAIQSSGGITFAQDRTAKFQSMPQSAIAEEGVDKILPPAGIAKELERLSQEHDLLHTIRDDGNDFTHDASLNELPNILQLLRQVTEVDFTHYKPSTIQRRIIRRMLLYRMSSLKEYLKYLRTHRSEVTDLYHDLLIHVTSFFRDPGVTDYLRKELLPRMIMDNKGSDLRIWVPGCSTGEEAYSIAILIDEVIHEKKSSIPFQIFATDLSHTAIAKARTGIYSKANLENVSEERLRKYFTKSDSSYRIVKSIRDRCVFAPHNVFKDPPFSKMNLISCCNLLIYLDPFLQKKIISTFHYALQPGGYLILGNSESVGTSQNLFKQLHRKHKIYISQKDGVSKSSMDVFPSIDPKSKAKDSAKLPERKSEKGNPEKMVDNILLSKFIPAAALINKDMEILQFRGSTGFFLEPSPGRASLNLLKMARNGLNFELRNAVHKAIKTGEPIRKTNIELKDKSRTYSVNIEVIPLEREDASLYLVVFEESRSQAPVEKNIKNKDTRDLRIKQLENELVTIREDMRSIIEEQEAVNEELQSANEEVVSSNEELQSINEELETSKEEIESTNEELMTMNAEIQLRNDQLSEAYDYADAVLTTLRESLLVLDSNTRVISANKTFYQTFNTVEDKTIGKILFELGDGQWNLPQLRLLLAEVIGGGTHFENYEVELDFPGIGNKILVLNGRKLIQKISKQELILLAIEDITEHTIVERLLKEREEWIRNIADNAPVMMWTSDAEGSYDFFNKTWLEFTGKKLVHAGEQWHETINPVDRKEVVAYYNECVSKREPFQKEYRLQRADGEFRWVLSSAIPYFDANGNFNGMIGTITEIHDQRLMNEELERRVSERTSDLQELNVSLQHSNHELQQFASVSSHDLQEPLRKISIFCNLLERKHADLNPEVTDYIDKIHKSALRMTRLIEDLLDFSKVSRSDEKFTTVDLNEILTDVMMDFDLQIKDKKAKVQFKNLPVVHAAPVQMKQLFHNLVSNAFKFSDSKRPLKINITSRNLSDKERDEQTSLKKNQQYAGIIVSDNGIGFNSKYSEKVFDIFQRLNDHADYPGTGIGLALCRRIMINHGGSITVRSEEGKGTTFYIILPLAE